MLAAALMNDGDNDFENSEVSALRSKELTKKTVSRPRLIRVDCRLTHRCRRLQNGLSFLRATTVPSLGSAQLPKGTPGSAQWSGVRKNEVATETAREQNPQREPSFRRFLEWGGITG